GPPDPGQGAAEGFPVGHPVVEVPEALASEDIDEVVGCRPATIEALIDDHSLPVLLGEVVPVEVGVAPAAGIRDVDVSEAAPRELIHLAAVGLDPVPLSEPRLAGDRYHGDRPRTGEGGARVD